MAKPNDTPMQDILRGISNGTTCLPDFQRGWVWDDERIRGLIASITCSYPLGAVMFLEYGGDSVRFKTRLFTNVTASPTMPEFLVLSIVKRLQIGENVSLCRSAGEVPLVVNQLALKATEEVLRHSVVIGISLARHACILITILSALANADVQSNKSQLNINHSKNEETGEQDNC